MDELVILPHHNLHGVPSNSIISDLRKQVEEIGSSETVDKLVQISGVDSMVEVIVSDHISCLKSKKRKKQNKKGGSTGPHMVGDLRLVLVVDGRGVPPENVVESFRHVADIRYWTGPTELTNLMPKSSTMHTMQRYIDAAVYYPGQDYDELSSKFDLRWLVDTGVNLGRGRQGLVRLMMIGGHAPAAVKIVKLAKRNRVVNSRTK